MRAPVGRAGKEGGRPEESVVKEGYDGQWETPTSST